MLTFNYDCAVGYRSLHAFVRQYGSNQERPWINGETEIKMDLRRNERPLERMERVQKTLGRMGRPLKESPKVSLSESITFCDHHVVQDFAPWCCTTMLHHDAAPWCCTTMLHHDAAQRCCTTMLHHDGAPRWCTTMLHHDAAPRCCHHDAAPRCCTTMPPRSTTMLHHDAAPRCCTTMLHHDAAPRCCTTMLHHAAAPWCCTMMLHHDAAPRCCTMMLHHDAAPWCCTTMLHQHQMFCSSCMLMTLSFRIDRCRWKQITWYRDGNQQSRLSKSVAVRETRDNKSWQFRIRRPTTTGLARHHSTRPTFIIKSEHCRVMHLFKTRLFRRRRLHQPSEQHRHNRQTVTKARMSTVAIMWQ